jgi:Base plate wedge protein 53
MPYFRQFPKTKYDFNNNGISTNITDIFRYVTPDKSFLDDISVYQYYNINDGDRPDIVSNILYGTPEYYWTFFVCNDSLKQGGLAAWPMSGQQFEDYMSNEYNGTCIITRPSIERDIYGTILDYRDSLSGRFQIGETVTGSQSGATGTLVKKDAQLSQLIVGKVTGNFIGSTVGDITVSEQITGSISQSVVSSYTVVPYRYAPHHYVDANGLTVYNSLFIDESQTMAGVQPGVEASELTAVTNDEYENSLNDARSQIRVVRPDEIYDFAQTFSKLING